MYLESSRVKTSAFSETTKHNQERSNRLLFAKLSKVENKSFPSCFTVWGNPCFVSYKNTGSQKRYNFTSD